MNGALLWGILLGLVIVMLWPGNPASRALVNVTGSLQSSLSNIQPGA